MSKSLVERLCGDQFVTPVKSVVNVMHEAAARIKELEAKTLHITISKTEMDFGGEGVILHPNHIAQVEELSRQQDQRIEELEQALHDQKQTTKSVLLNYKTILKDGEMPDCMITDGNETCTAYRKLQSCIEALKERDRVMVDALSEIKASDDGESSQRISEIIKGCIEELALLEDG